MCDEEMSTVQKNTKAKMEKQIKVTEAQSKSSINK